MPKKGFVLTIIILVSTLLFANILCLNANIISANAYETGVKIGDWIEYEVNYTDNVPPIYPLYTRREILDVKGTVLTINTTYTMSDGTFSSSTADGDVVNGTGPCALVFIPANLGVGNFVSIQNFTDEAIRISAETTRPYLDITRTVIYAEFTGSGFDIKIYWDKEKGVALEIYGVGTYTQTSRVIRTNMWGSEFSDGGPLMGLEAWIFLIIMISLASILTYGYIHSQRRMRKRKKRPYR